MRRVVLGYASLLLAWPGAAGAQPASADGAAWMPGPALASRVQRAIAERWGVEPGAVRLEWPAVDAGVAPADDAVFELVGTGAGGTWWLVLREPGQGARAARVRIRAGVEVEEAVAARRLERGAVLVEEDIERRSAVHWGAPPPDAPAVTAGWVARRVIPAGEPLRPPAVAPPLLIDAGELVQVIVRRGTVEVTLRARAAGPAAAGERVAVRTEAGRRLEGIAIAPGTVRID
ncbi:MAG TPA: flagellar basal body P-ring formation chaperone FlgA [Longimicrobiales bacterium]